MEYIDKKQRGFTLLETLVAILVLSLSIVAPMLIASRTLVSAVAAQEQIIAVYLAQEAIEALRAVVDNDALEGDTWLNGFASDNGGAIPFDTEFLIDPTLVMNNAGFMKTCTGACPKINFDLSDKLYQHGTTAGDNQPSIFTRTVRVSQINSNEITVTATVTWTLGPTTRSFTTRENLLNWRAI